jgi:hypothetical protein
MTTKAKQGGSQRGRRETRPYPPPAQGRSDDANAFLPDPDGGPAKSPEDLSESLAEEFVEAATSGEDLSDERLDATVPEEVGGPFVETSAAEELGGSVDDVNPPDAEPEPLPRAVAGVTTEPEADETDEADEAQRGRKPR